MRIPGAMLVMVLLTACGGESVDPATQERLGLDALLSAGPAMSAALDARSHSFGGLHVACRLGNSSFEYTVNGGFQAPAASERTGLEAVAAALTDAGWTLRDVADEEHALGATRDEVELYVSRAPRTDEGVAWRVTLTAPCVTLSDDGVDAARSQGIVDLSDELPDES